MILPSFHPVGKIPEEIERLNRLHNTGAIQDAVHLSILGETPSLPACRLTGVKFSQKLENRIFSAQKGIWDGGKYRKIPGQCHVVVVDYD